MVPWGLGGPLAAIRCAHVQIWRPGDKVRAAGGGGGGGSGGGEGGREERRASGSRGRCDRAGVAGRRAVIEWLS